MAGFVQIVEYDTSHIDEVRTLGDKFRAERQAERSGAEVKVTIAADRDRPNHYFTVAEFPSYDVAMQNSNRPETSEFAARLAELCDGPPTFHNLDVLTTMES